MNFLLFSPFTGFLALSFLFFISTVIVVLIKSVIFFINSLTISVAPKKQPKKREKTKSIVINPDEVNRIYVKKN
ncbi:MAG: hypothetical protein IKC71_04305 [Clostridia bacterium]|nr:hypothetical protein [Clostridia bacterium]